MTLREALADYLRLRRRLGFEMPQDGRLLEGFVRFLERAGAERITTELALEWARMPAGAHRHYWRQRLSVVRGFARHLATIDPASEVPSKDLLRRGVVHVRAGKQKKQRELPLHPSTIRALREYARLRDACFPEPSAPAFFIGARGRRAPRGELNRTFTQLVREVGLDGRGERARPRPHDLRHALAVHTHSWTGITPGRTSTGGCRCCPHSSGMSTRLVRTGYLEAVPELLQLISRRLERLPEVLP
jgi:integrase